MRDSMEIDPLAACHVASLEPFDQWCSHFLYSECYSACGEFVQLFFTQHGIRVDLPLIYIPNKMIHFHFK
jgi:hypothetical protein